MLHGHRVELAQCHELTGAVGEKLLNECSESTTVKDPTPNKNQESRTHQGLQITDEQGSEA